ncbi:hypothetical protein OYC64_011077 [Pagothenia borchgrevinki]|uniref:Uncharacterized protein n=1 Tax=Pagothenia borchgrevinki TaxID=8213 RepID=A0ABD2GY48_PAGBO
MKPSNDSEAKIVAQQEEIDRCKINEKHLMNQNAEHKRKLSSMVTDEFNLKKKEKKKADLKRTVHNPTRALEIMREELDKSKVENRHLKGVIASVKKVSDENPVYKGKYLEYKNKFGVEKSFRQEKQKEAEHFGNHSKENRRLNMLVEKLSHDVEELAGHKNFSIKKIEELGEVIRKKDKDMAAVEKEEKNSYESAFKYKLNCETLKPYCGKGKALTRECERLSEEQKKQRRQDDVNNSTIQDLKKTVVHLQHRIVGWENKYANQEVDMKIVREENRVLIKAAETHEEELKVKKMRDLENKLQNQERKTKHATDAHFQEIIKLRAVNVELEKKLTQTITHADGVVAERNLLLQNQERKMKHATDAHFQEIIKLRAVNVELEKKLTQTITHADGVVVERNLLLQNQERKTKHATDAHFQEIIKLKAVNVELEKTLTHTITHADGVVAERNLLLQNQERKMKHATDAQFQEIIKLRAVNVELEKKLTQTITHADGVVAERNLLQNQERKTKHATDAQFQEIIKLRAVNETVVHLQHRIVGWENKYANQEVDMEIVREENRVLIKAAETHEEEAKHMEFEVKKMRDLEIKLQNQERKTKHATDAHFQEIIKLRAVNVELEKKLTQTITHADGVEAERNLHLQNQERKTKHPTDAHFQEIIKLRAVNVELEKTLTQTITHADRVEAERNLLLQNQEGKTNGHIQEIIKLITHADGVVAERNLLLQKQREDKAQQSELKEIIDQKDKKLKEIIDQKYKKLQDKTCEVEVQKVQIARLIETLRKELQRRADMEVQLKLNQTRSCQDTDRVVTTGEQMFQKAQILEDIGVSEEEMADRYFWLPRLDKYLKCDHSNKWKERVYQPEYDNLKEENQRVKKTQKMDNLKTKEKLRNSGSGDMNKLTPLPPISQKPRSPAEETARDQAVSGYKPRPNRVLIKSKCLPKILKTVPLPPTGTVKLLPHPPPKPPQHPAPRCRRLVIGSTENCVALRVVGTKF